MSGVIAKCIAAPKAKTRELAVQITLMYIEIEKYEAVQEEILKGMEYKNPKMVAACVSAITQALRLVTFVRIFEDVVHYGICLFLILKHC
jgi:cytoskeleton-associated protein 5